MFGVFSQQVVESAGACPGQAEDEERSLGVLALRFGVGLPLLDQLQSCAQDTEEFLSDIQLPDRVELSLFVVALEEYSEAFFKALVSVIGKARSPAGFFEQGILGVCEEAGLPAECASERRIGFQSLIGQASGCARG